MSLHTARTEKNNTQFLFWKNVVCRFNLPFYLLTCQHDNRICPPCTDVRQHSMHRLMYLMGPRKMAQNNDVHDDVLIDIVVYELLLCDATSNQQTLKHLRQNDRENKKRVNIKAIKAIN